MSMLASSMIGLAEHPPSWSTSGLSEGSNSYTYLLPTHYFHALVVGRWRTHDLSF